MPMFDGRTTRVHGPAGRICTRQWVADEARALLARVTRVRPLMQQETMIPAAAPDMRTQRAIETTLADSRRRLRHDIAELIRWLGAAESRDASGAEMQRRLVGVRMQFNDTISNLDLFIDALTQRSERDTGLWLAGLEVAAQDVLALPGYYEPPPLLCYLERGPGAAIRRARTRLPGGGSNPIALIQIPRERMTGTGVAASLAHETGHQAAALLGLVESLRTRMDVAADRSLGGRIWALWQRWISEIVADLWALARLGPTATLGLMGVVSLPKFFVFRVSVNDPHPPPWIRVRLSAALGQQLYPDPQWAEMLELWDELYPLEGVPHVRRAVLAALAESAPRLARFLLDHRAETLANASLADALRTARRDPQSLTLAARGPGWKRALANAQPSLALAILGQARWNRAITPDGEREGVEKLLTTWAMRRAIAGDRAITNPN
ncbi:MAG TPA: hypothetical protein VFG69_01895 [Nannocystaceae bacterium]|nr:hypothetical protein [Nannocystaceae bacterium]